MAYLGYNYPNFNLIFAKITSIFIGFIHRNDEPHYAVEYLTEASRVFLFFFFFCFFFVFFLKNFFSFNSFVCITHVSHWIVISAS
jgi:hypothetical protein